MNAKLTGETITDDQIRDWEADVLATGTTKQKCAAVDLATRALIEVPSMRKMLEWEPNEDPRPNIARIQRKRKRARERIAEILSRPQLEITADTISAAQIRELAAHTRLPAVRRLCKIALNDAPTYLRSSVVREARARCAALLNAAEGRP